MWHVHVSFTSQANMFFMQDRNAAKSPLVSIYTLIASHPCNRHDPGANLSVSC